MSSTAKVSVNGKNVVVTGTIRGYGRPAAIAKLVAAGAKVNTQVTASTDMAITGSRFHATARKLQDARKRGLPIVSWDDLDLTPASASAQAAPAAPATSGGSTAGSSTGSAGGSTGSAGGSTGSAGGSTGSAGGPTSSGSPNSPTPDEQLMDKLRRSLAQQPTWKNDGKKLTITSPDASVKIELPVMPKPGPYSPKVRVHDVLGQPDVLYTVALAIAEGEHSLLEGPKATAKTTTYRWFADQLNWNIVTQRISRGTEAEDMIGGYKPIESGQAARFGWTWGPVSKSVIASEGKCRCGSKGCKDHPTLLVFEEANRIGNPQEYADLYPLLDDTRELSIDTKRDESGEAQVLVPGRLYVGATMNPTDDEHEDYIGVTELDPAMKSRFFYYAKVDYPSEEIEAAALVSRVPKLGAAEAVAMVQAATKTRKSEDMRFSISFRELLAWAKAMPYYGPAKAAEIAIIQKAHPDYRPAIRDVVKLVSV